MRVLLLVVGPTKAAAPTPLRGIGAATTPICLRVIIIIIIIPHPTSRHRGVVRKMVVVVAAAGGFLLFRMEMIAVLTVITVVVVICRSCRTFIFLFLPPQQSGLVSCQVAPIDRLLVRLFADGSG